MAGVEAEQVSEQGADVRAQVDALNELAATLLKTEDARALELAETAARLAREEGYDSGEARALLTQGQIYTERGEAEQAIPCLETALINFNNLKDAEKSCESLESLGKLYLEMGEIPTAENYLNLAITICRANNLLNYEARVLNLLAGVNHRSGEYISALRNLKDAISIHEKLKNKTEEAKLLCNAGILSTSLGEYSKALELLMKSYQILNTIVNDERIKSFVISNLGHLYFEMGNLNTATLYFRESLELSVKRQDRLSEATAILNIGVAQAKAENDQEAEPTFRSAFALSREIQYRQGELSALDGLGGILSRRGQLEGAATAHAEAVQIAQEIEDLEGELDALLHLGQVQAQLGKQTAALASLTRALKLAEKADHKKAASEAHLALAQVYKGAGDFEQALTHHERYHQQEKALFNEEGDKKTRELSAQFDVERARHEAEMQRLWREAADVAREQAEAQVRERTEELERSQLEVVTRLAVAAEYRDDTTGEHTWRVGQVSALIARELGLPEEEVEVIRVAARLHDVGKIGIPDAILLKPGKFTPEEYERMKTHASVGARILSGGASQLLRAAEEIALTHHERWDGGGYPNRLAGETIPLAGRIVAVADVFDALTQARPYKAAWTAQEALAELGKQAGSHFDPQVLKAAERVFAGAEFARLLGAPPQPETPARYAAVGRQQREKPLDNFL